MTPGECHIKKIHRNHQRSYPVVLRVYKSVDQARTVKTVMLDDSRASEGSWPQDTSSFVLSPH